jgi:hypothetical protein
MSDEGFRRTKGDVGHALAKAGLSAIPFVGGPAAELMNLIWEPALSKRRDEWLKGLAENLHSLTEKVEGFSLEDLSHNESFITTSIQASQTAVRNHQKEKLEALRNAVLNSALGITIDEEIQLLSISLIERLTVSHIKILRHFSTLAAGVTENMYAKNSMSKEIASRFHLEFNQDSYFQAHQTKNKEWEWQKYHEIAFIQSIVNELENIGLIRTEQSTTDLINGMHYCCTEITHMGNQLLQFISTPDVLSEQGETL